MNEVRERAASDQLASLPAPQFTVRQCVSPEEREAVFRLRYAVYVEEMGRPQPYADHVRRRVEDPLDATAFVYGVELDGVLVGTVRANFVSDDIGMYRALYGLTDISPEAGRKEIIVTALMLFANLRKTAAAVRLLSGAFAHVWTLGAEVQWIDCNEPLVPMFMHFGFTSVGPIVHPVYGPVRLMRCDFTDHAHLASVGSPLLAVARDPATFLPTQRAPMTTRSMLDRLRADFTIVAERFHAVPACDRLRRGAFTRDEYASLMSSVALQARDNPQIQAYATAFFRGSQRDIVRSFYKHAVSEIGHDQLAANDVAALGFPVNGLLDSQPRSGTIALTAFAYYTISHHDPVGYLGYLFFLEFLPTSFAAEYVAALDTAGIPADARSFLYDHATVDIGHNKLMERYIEQLIVDEETYAAVLYAMEVTASLYARMIDEAFTLAPSLGQAAPVHRPERRRLVAVAHTAAAAPV